MEYTVEFWPLAVAAVLLAAVVGALWLFRRQVARDKDDREQRTERALASARRAVAKTRRGRRPHRWVRARMQLAMLLTEAAGRRPDRARFDEALAILDQAIPVLREAKLTPELATAVYYKGRVQWGLGGMEPGCAMLEAAVATFRECLAIEPWPRHLLRGVVVSLPAVILVDIGDRKDDVAILEEGVALAREAVESARPRVPIDKSIALRNLAHALGMLGRKTANPALLEEAIAAAREAIATIRQQTFPGHWVACQANLGYALGELGMLRGDAAMLDEALSVMEAAQSSDEVKWRREGHVMLAQNAGGVRLALGRLRGDAAMLRRAADDLTASLEAFQELAMPFGEAEAARALAQVLAALAGMEGDAECRSQAARLYRQAMEIFTRAGATRHAAETQEDLRLLEEASDRPQAKDTARHRPVYIVR